MKDSYFAFKCDGNGTVRICSRGLLNQISSIFSSNAKITEMQWFLWVTFNILPRFFTQRFIELELNNKTYKVSEKFNLGY